MFDTRRKQAIAFLSAAIGLTLAVACTEPGSPGGGGPQDAAAQLSPPGATDPGIVDPATGKLTYRQPLMNLAASTSPDFTLALSYSTLGLYRRATTWNIEDQAIETGLGWAVPALHQRIFRNTRGTGYEWDDTFYLQNGGSARELIYQGTGNDDDGSYQAYTTTDANYRLIRFYPPVNAVDPNNVGLTEGSYQPGYWKMVDTNGLIFYYGAYRSSGSLFAIENAQNPDNPINPYQTVTITKQSTGQTYQYNAGDLLGDDMDDPSATLCREIQINNGSVNDAKTGTPPDGCNFIPIDYSVAWDESWIGPGDGTANQQNIETAWHLAEMESPITGYATSLSYTCHTQNVGRPDSAGDDPAARYATLACYLYQVAGADGSLLSLKYLTQNSALPAGSGAANKPDGSEVIDNHMEDREPDAYQEQYRVARLVSVDRYEGVVSDSATRLSGASLNYAWLQEPDVTTYMTKPVLSSVSHVVYSSSAQTFGTQHSHQLEPAVVFEYYGQPGSSDGVKVSADSEVFYNQETGAIFGGLKQITNGLGTRFTIRYQRNSLGDIQQQYFAVDAKDADGRAIPDQLRVPFWGNDYMVLAGNGGAGDGSGETVTKFAVFTFTASGWKLSRVIESDYRAPEVGFSHGSAYLKSSPVKDMVALSENYFAFLSPVEDEHSGRRVCADLMVLKRNRDASGSTRDWQETPQQLGSTFCLNNVRTNHGRLHVCEGFGCEYTSMTNRSEDDNRRVPALAVKDSVVAVVAGTPSSDTNTFTVWRTHDDGGSFQQVANEVLSGDANRPVAALVAPGYAAAFDINFDIHAEENQLNITLVDIERDQVGVPVSRTVNYSNAEFPETWKTSGDTKTVYLGFSPKVIDAFDSGGFPLADVQGAWQYYFMGDRDKVEIFSTDSARQNAEPKRSASANFLVWFPITRDSSTEDLSLSSLVSYPFVADPEDPDGYDYAIYRHDTGVGESNVKSLTTSDTAAAVGDGGVLWTGFTSYTYLDRESSGDKSFDNSSWFTCHFDKLVYDPDASAWSLQRFNISDSGIETDDFDGSTCIPGDYKSDTSFTTNQMTSAGTAGQQIFSTLGQKLEYKYWAYAPLMDRDPGAATDPTPLFLADAGGSYAATYEPPKAKPRKWAKTWYEVETVIGKIMNVGFTVMMAFGAMEGGPLDIALLAWQFASDLVNSLAGDAFKLSGGSSAYFGLGRYLVDGEQLWFVTHDARLASTDGANLFNPHYGLADGAEYFGSAYNFVAARGGPVDDEGDTCDDNKEGPCEIYFTRLRNGNIFDTGSEAGMEPVGIGNSERDDGFWFVHRAQSYDNDGNRNNNCEFVDCTRNVNFNTFLIYHSGEEADGKQNRSFSYAGGDFQLQRISSKSRVNTHYDYAVASVTVSDGYDEYATTYLYANDGDGEEPLHYGSVSGATVIYSQVITCLACTDPAQGAHTRRRFFTASNPFNRDFLPDVLYQSDGNLARVEAADYLGQVIGRVYQQDLIRAPDGGSVQYQQSEALIADHAQSDDHGNALVERRASLTAATATIYDGDALVKQHRTFNRYFQIESDTSTRSHYNHSSRKGVPHITVADESVATRTSVPIYAWQVTDTLPPAAGQTEGPTYQDFMQQTNRLDEVYLSQTVIHDAPGGQPTSDTHPAYIKEAVANYYRPEQQATGEVTYLADQTYTRVNPDIWDDDYDYDSSWMSPQAVIAGTTADILSSTAWLPGPQTPVRDGVTLSPLEVQAATGEVSTLFSAYSVNSYANSWGSYNTRDYPYRWQYASFSGVSQAWSEDSSTPAAVQAAYLGFERYEQQRFDVDRSTIIASNGSISCTTPLVQAQGGLAVDNANTGTAYCKLQATGNALVTGPAFSATGGDQYILSLWVRPNDKNSTCTLLGDGSYRSTSAFYNQADYRPDGSNWYYLESIVPANSLTTGVQLVSCLDASNTPTTAGVDDIRITPIDSGFSATVYDTDPGSYGYLLPIAVHTNRGHIQRQLYDFRRLPYLSLSQDINLPQSPPKAQNDYGVVHQYSYVDLPIEPGFSRWDGFAVPYGDNVCELPPNASSSFQAGIPNVVSGFGLKGTNKGQYVPLVSTGTTLTLTETDAFAVRFVTSTEGPGSGKPVTLSWQTRSDATHGTTETEIILIDRNLVYQGRTILLDGLPQYVTLVAQGGSFTLIGDGRILLSDYSAGVDSLIPVASPDTSSFAALTLSGMSGSLVDVVFSPISGAGSVSYSDAFSRPIETHQLDGYFDSQSQRFHFSDLVTAVYYDGFGNPQVVSQPVEYSALGDTTTNRAFPTTSGETADTPSQPDLLQFRGVSQDPATGQVYRRFGALDWSADTGGYIYTGAVPDSPAFDLGSELVDFYSSGGPGQALLQNDDEDAAYALISALSYDSPLARMQKSTVAPGAAFGRGGDGDPDTDQDLAVLQDYQQDPLHLLDQITGQSVGEIQLALVTTNEQVQEQGVAYSLSIDDQVVQSGSIREYGSSVADPNWVDIDIPATAGIRSDSVLKLTIDSPDWQVGTVSDTFVYVGQIQLAEQPIPFGPDAAAGQVVLATTAVSSGVTEYALCMAPTPSTRVDNGGGNGSYASYDYTYYVGGETTCLPELEGNNAFWQQGRLYTYYPDPADTSESYIQMGIGPSQPNWVYGELRFSMENVPAQAENLQYDWIQFVGSLLNKNADGRSALPAYDPTTGHAPTTGGYYFIRDFNIVSDEGKVLSTGYTPAIPQGTQDQNKNLVFSNFKVYYLPTQTAIEATDGPDNVTLAIPSTGQSVDGKTSLYLTNVQIYQVDPGASPPQATGKLLGFGGGSKEYAGVMGELANADNGDGDSLNRRTCLSPNGNSGVNKQCDASTLGTMDLSYSDKGNDWVKSVTPAPDSTTYKDSCASGASSSNGACPAMAMYARPDDSSAHRYKTLIGVGWFWGGSGDTRGTSRNTLADVGLPTSGLRVDAQNEDTVLFHDNIQYNYKQQKLPTANKRFGFTLSDMWGAPMLGVTSWDDKGAAPDDTTSLASNYSGGVYDFNLASGDIEATTQSWQRQPNWYQQDGGEVDSNNANFSLHQTSYLLPGIWRSVKDSDSAVVHQFQDRSGRTRLVVNDPQFTQPDFGKPGTEQIASYTLYDDIGRVVETGRLRDTDYSADDWLTYAQALSTSNPTGATANDSEGILGDDHTCRVGQVVYDGYDDALALHAEGGVVIAPGWSWNTNARQAAVQSTRYNRSTRAPDDSNMNIWSSGALGTAACDNTTDAATGAAIDYIADTTVYDDLGRVRLRYSNRIAGDDYAQARLYRTSYVHGDYDDSHSDYSANDYTDIGTVFGIEYPDDAKGTSGTNLAVLTTLDRLGRKWSTTAHGAATNVAGVAATATGTEVFRQGHVQLGRQLSYQQPDMGVSHYSYLDFQFQLTRRCQISGTLPYQGACEAADSAMLYDEDLAYAIDYLDAESETSAVCGALSYVQYTNRQLAYLEKSGPAYFDPDYGPANTVHHSASTLENSQECYSYDGMNRLVALTRMGPDGSGYTPWYSESYTYDANGNMLTRARNYIKANDQVPACTRITDRFDSSQANNQVESTVYGETAPIPGCAGSGIPFDRRDRRGRR